MYRIMHSVKKHVQKPQTIHLKERFILRLPTKEKRHFSQDVELDLLLAQYIADMIMLPLVRLCDDVDGLRAHSQSEKL